MKIVIDAGHGPNTPGKRCPDDSMREYHFNAPTARYAAAELVNYEGVVVSMATFEDGRDVPIDERVRKANGWGADVFVSIHANAMDGVWGTANGVEVLVDYRQPKAAVALANAVQRKLVAATGLRDRGLQYRDNVGVLNYTKMTAILVECGFMDNRVEAALLKSDAYRQKCAKAIVAGIVETYGLSRKTAAPPPIQSKEEYEMAPEDANKIIAFLKAGYSIAPNEEFRRLANVLRKASGQPEE